MTMSGTQAHGRVDVIACLRLRSVSSGAGLVPSLRNVVANAAAKAARARGMQWSDGIRHASLLTCCACDASGADAPAQLASAIVARKGRFANSVYEVLGFCVETLQGRELLLFRRQMMLFSLAFLLFASQAVLGFPAVFYQNGLTLSDEETTCLQATEDPAGVDILDAGYDMEAMVVVATRVADVLQPHLHDVRLANFRLAVYGDAVDVITDWIALRGQVEGALTAAMLQGLVASQRLASSRGLSVTPTLLDVGANLGWYTLVASRAGFPAVAFEPMPSNRQLLAASALCLNPDVAGRISVVPMALSDRVRECFISTYQTNWGNSQIYCPDEGESPCPIRSDATCVEGAAVKLAVLDDLLLSGTLDVPAASTMKIDVEGHELSVLRGASRLLSSPSAPLMVQVEVELPDLNEVLAFMRDKGYVLLTREFVELPRDRCHLPRIPWVWRAWAVEGELDVDLQEEVSNILGSERQRLNTLAMFGIRDHGEVYDDLAISVTHRGALYWQLLASDGGLLLQTDVIFARPEVLPFLPGAPTVAAWEGPMPFRRYSILGDNLSAIAGSLARFALEDYQALREMYAEGC